MSHALRALMDINEQLRVDMKLIPKVGGRKHRMNIACRWIYLCNLILLVLNVALVSVVAV